MKTVTIIGDVHSNTYDDQRAKYLNIINMCDSEYTIQLGDLGWPYDMLSPLDPSKHRVLAGNHDHYGIIATGLWKHFLGDFGTFLDDIFFVRGGFSLNHRKLIPGIDWWPEEEISLSLHEYVLSAYRQAKPKIVISHECPLEVARIIGLPDKLRKWQYNPITFTTKTQNLLQKMLETHQPEAWFFGHYHRSFSMVNYGTYFRCLNILETHYLQF